VQLAGRGFFDCLRFAAGPADYGVFYLRKFAETKMKTALVLRSEAGASGNFLDLMLAIPK
jgi:hypothetical protein